MMKSTNGYHNDEMIYITTIFITYGPRDVITQTIKIGDKMIYMKMH